MNGDQRDSINRVRSLWAANHDSDYEVGSYRNSDIRSVLDVLENLEDKISLVNADLEDIKSYLETANPEEFSNIVLGLIDSSLSLIKDESLI